MGNNEIRISNNEFKISLLFSMILIPIGVGCFVYGNTEFARIVAFYINNIPVIKYIRSSK